MKLIYKIYSRARSLTQSWFRTGSTSIIIFISIRFVAASRCREQVHISRAGLVRVPDRDPDGPDGSHWRKITIFLPRADLILDTRPLSFAGFSLGTVMRLRLPGYLNLYHRSGGTLSVVVNVHFWKRTKQKLETLHILLGTLFDKCIDKENKNVIRAAQKIHYKNENTLIHIICTTNFFALYCNSKTILTIVHCI